MSGRSTRRTVLLTLAGIAVVVLAVFAYVQYQRPRADAVLAARTTGVMVASIEDKQTGVMSGPSDQSAPEWAALYFGSESAGRVRATAELRRTWTAITAVHELDQLRAEGLTQPPVDSVTVSGAALAAFPGLRDHVVTVAGRPAFADTTETATFLLGEAAASADKAMASIEAQYGWLGLDLKAVKFPAAFPGASPMMPASAGQ